MLKHTFIPLIDCGVKESFTALIFEPGISESYKK